MHGPGALAVVLAGLALLAGCDLSGEESEPVRPDEAAQPREHGLESPEGRLIRAWLAALERADYTLAATFFAPGVLIDQGEPHRLPDAAAARFFNATLPCRADLVRLKDERATVLASFRLRTGPGGPCEGIVKVRLTIRRGKFTVWRQFPVPGEEVAGEPA